MATLPQNRLCSPLKKKCRQEKLKRKMLPSSDPGLLFFQPALLVWHLIYWGRRLLLAKQFKKCIIRPGKFIPKKNCREVLGHQSSNIPKNLTGCMAQASCIRDRNNHCELVMTAGFLTNPSGCCRFSRLSTASISSSDLASRCPSEVATMQQTFHEILKVWVIYFVELQGTESR